MLFRRKLSKGEVACVVAIALIAVALAIGLAILVEDVVVLRWLLGSTYALLGVLFLWLIHRS